MPRSIDASVANRRHELTVALLPWGDVFEDYLDSIRVSLHVFCTQMTGGWLFGYVEALSWAGIRTVIVCVSSSVSTPVRRMHHPTGATIWMLPAPKRYSVLRRRMPNPHGWTVEEIFGQASGARHQFHKLLRAIAPYAATPIGPLARVLRHEQCDALLCQEYEYARFDLCVALGKMLGMPVFGTFQGGDTHFSRLEGLLRSWTLHGCAGLIIAAQTEAARVQASYGVPDRKIAHIFNPLDLTMWRPGDRAKARAALELPAAARIAIWHGRVEMHRKGLDVLLEAWRRVCSNTQQKEVRLLLVGTGNDAQNMRQRISDMRLEGIHWVNEYIVDRATVQSYLSAADVYAFPSRHEGFPVAPLEAMACELPVVAAAAPGVPDILEGMETGGFVVPCGDAEALASVLGDLLENKTKSRKLGRQARRRAEQSFSYGAVGRQLHAFLT